jgi:tetratricopeptide (TPR) repeat protein
LIRKQFCIFSLIIGLLLISNTLFADLSVINAKKALLYIDNGLKAEAVGNADEALTLYEQAAELTPGDPVPTLYIAKLFTKVGMYTQAQRRLTEIPKNSLTNSQKSEIHFLNTILSISKGSLEEAAVAARDALKLDPQNTDINIVYASLNYLLGFPSKSFEILGNQPKFSTKTSSRALLLSFWLDMHLGEVQRAYNTAGLLARLVKRSKHDDKTFVSRFIQVPFLYFMAFIPVCINPLLGAIYFFILFSILGLLIYTLAVNKSIKSIFIFATIGTALMLGIQQASFNLSLTQIMKPGFSIYDNTWIIPRLLIASHFITLALLVLLPLFKYLPQKQRPLSKELYGVWFFCFFFMIFICSFQGRLDSFTRFGLMTLGAFFSLIASVTIPMGRYVIFSLTSFMGLSKVSEILSADSSNETPISFTEAKIFQANAHKLIIEEKFLDLIIQSKKLLHHHSFTALPTLWQQMILAMIFTEDYDSASSNINTYLEAFADTTHYEKGLLYQAYLKSNKGDFADALKIIKSLPNARVKSFSNDETAICLLVLGRCGCHYKELVQAHIDLTKAMTYAKIPLLKAEALLEITALDYKMNAKVAIQKWAKQAHELKGNSYTQAYCKTILSMAHAFEKEDEKALTAIKEAIALIDKNSNIYGWYGHLLLQTGKTSEAEAILAHMTSGSFASDQLIAEITKH